MIRLVAAFLVPWCALAAWGVRAALDPNSPILAGLSFQRSWILYLLAVLVALPAVAVWLAADLFDRWRPRRVFDHRVRSRVAPLIAGGGAGLLSVAAALALLPFADGRLHDAVVTGGTSALATLAVVSVLPACRRGRCVVCGYDLRATRHRRPCPECGGHHTAG